jgi:hypothetical protein
LPQRFLIAASIVLAAAASGGGPGVANAQPVHAGGAAATRSVSRYLALERDLQQALAAKDEAAVNARVEANFEYRTPASTEVKDRDTWLHKVSHAPARIRDLTTNEQDDTTVVSFLADAQGRTRFIVDVWKGDTLMSRYSSLAPEAPKAPRRPDGRE